MDAVILAAGLGTRLRPYTDATPKALIPVGGVPMLERVAERLLRAGVDRLIVNLHHLADQIREFVASRDGFGVEVLFSEEPERPLETGGALRQASQLLRGDRPFFVHNSDILSDIPLEEMYGTHLRSGALATLATMVRSSTRQLLFDDLGLLGRTDERRDLRLEVREPRGTVRELAFAGVHVVEPRFLGLLTEHGAFSILQPYLRLSAAGESIQPYRVDGSHWMDIGKPEQLRAAEAWLERSLPTSPPHVHLGQPAEQERG